MNGGGATKKDKETQDKLKQRQNTRRFIEDMENFINTINMMTREPK